MSSTPKTVYLNLSEITEVHEKDVFVKDVAKIYCSDTNLQNKCECVKVKHIQEGKSKRYVETALDVIRKLEALDPSVQVNNVGKVEYIIDYQPPKPPHYVWQWAKTAFVCVIASWKINTDPTPLEVEMRLYEDNISKTLIQNDGRKEQDIDIQ